MNEPCRREREIIEGLGAGGLSDTFQEHLRGCADCADALLVAGLLREAAQRQRPSIPHPAVLLLKAERRRLAVRQEAATRPISWLARLAPPLLGGSFLVLLWSNAAAVADWAGPIGPVPAESVAALLLVLAALGWLLAQVSLYKMVEE